MLTNHRSSTYPIDPMFLERWSPRAFSPEPLPLDSLMTMLEAARWTASSYNTQPWRFIYALRDTPPWEDFLGLLVPFNRDWARSAAALVFAVSLTASRSPRSGEEHPLPTHSFDTGAACAYIALQALKLGWHVHGMIGFDHERARARLNLPTSLSMEAAFAIGRLGNKETLPKALQTREAPSDRIPLTELVFEGSM